MPFDQELEEQRLKAKLPKYFLNQDLNRARKLLRTCQEKGITVGPHSARAWAKHFAQIRAVDLVEDKRIKEVFNWYVANIGGDYVPDAFCGKSFRDKFGRIERAMEKDRKRNPVISGHALRLAEDLKSYVPRRCRPTLAACVQVTLANASDFIHKLIIKERELEKKAHYTDDKDRNIYRVTTEHSNVKGVLDAMGNAASFTRKWVLGQAATIARGLEAGHDLSGDMTRRAWARDSPPCRNFNVNLSGQFYKVAKELYEDS